MLEKILRTTEKIIPKKLYKLGQPVYHYLLALAGALIYRFPSKKISVVAVTGTKGKSTVTELINTILEEAGHKTAVQNTIHFKVGDVDTPNKYKMSMPGRFFIQHFLRRAVDAGCDWVVMEITSEGSKQFRHKFIDLNALIFTNLSPEHIESHGSYEKYRQAKLNIADSLKKPNSILIVNSDDKESNLFLKKKADKKIEYKLEEAKPYSFADSIEMQYKDLRIFSKLQGEFNISNILAAAKFASEIGIEDEVIKNGIENLKEVSGRVQKINAGQNFEVYVDYAHTPNSLEALYKTFEGKKKICVLGNTGGGRDKWKRPEMAKIADDYCDQIILTNEDPYDEDPRQIINEMDKAIEKHEAEIIIDRREAIRKAVESASDGDVVLITGKGTDPYIMIEDGRKIPWSDAEVTREELENLK